MSLPLPSPDLHMNKESVKKNERLDGQEKKTAAVEQAFSKRETKRMCVSVCVRESVCLSISLCIVVLSSCLVLLIIKVSIYFY